MCHQLVRSAASGFRPLLAQIRQRLAHDLGLRQPALSCDSLNEGGGLRIDSDVQHAHDSECITGCNTEAIGA